MEVVEGWTATMGKEDIDVVCVLLVLSWFGIRMANCLLFCALNVPSRLPSNCTSLM